MVSTDHRDKLDCLVTKQTQEQAGNQAIGEMLARIDQDSAMKARLDKAAGLQAMMKTL